MARHARVRRNRRRQPPRPPRPSRLKELPFNRLIPNILTVLALCAGFTAVRFAIEARWKEAVVAVALAAILDTLDGAIARLLKAQSKFGAELDSLADFVSFGVAPALILYFWTLQGAAGIGGWAVSLAYAVACGLRLARFNTALARAEPPQGMAPAANTFFQGVPAPAAAGLALLPLVGSFPLGDTVLRLTPVAGGFALASATLMVSTVPTFSLKGVRIRRERVPLMLLVVGLIAAFLVSRPWVTLSLLGLGYIISLPLSVRAFHRLKRDARAVRQQEETAPVDEAAKE